MVNQVYCFTLVVMEDLVQEEILIRLDHLEGMHTLLLLINKLLVLEEIHFLVVVQEEMVFLPMQLEEVLLHMEEEEEALLH